MSIEKILSEDISRRDLLALGIDGLAFLVAGCAGSHKGVREPPEFNMKKFVAWYSRNRLYNNVNPNLRTPHYPSPSERGGLWAATFKKKWGQI
jgi:hypothetical protein